MGLDRNRGDHGPALEGSARVMELMVRKHVLDRARHCAYVRIWGGLRDSVEASVAQRVQGPVYERVGGRVADRVRVRVGSS